SLTKVHNLPADPENCEEPIRRKSPDTLRESLDSLAAPEEMPEEAEILKEERPMPLFVRV
ncbi:MAG: hypothetical protein VX607_07960, partial [Planctomycetota bacterium]|nr:hypothetical protein [Planctomycetota bacterium]